MQNRSRRLSYELLTEQQQKEFEERLDYDLMLADEGARYRINVGYFNGNVGATIRVLSGDPSTIEELYLPDVVGNLAHVRKGLVLVTGSTSQGETTTMAAMINEINATQKKHIVTIEDPIEYIHTNKNGIVRQREVGRDTQSFYTGLRAALRQDPDVIAIGEMRDLETIKIGGGQRVACEILIATSGAKNIIRRKGGYHLRTVIATGKKYGMCTMSKSVEGLVDEGIITEQAGKSVLVSYSH